MGAIVELGQRVPVGLVELANFNTRSTHTLKQIFFHLRAADPVDPYVDFDTGPRTLGQCAGESLAYITRPINILVSKLMVFLAAWMAPSTGGKIWSPLSNSLTLFPATMLGPSKPPMERAPHARRH